MKNIKFYPKRALITLSLFLFIPLLKLVAHVYEIHIPSPEEIVQQAEEESYDDITKQIHELEKNRA